MAMGGRLITSPLVAPPPPARWLVARAEAQARADAAACCPGNEPRVVTSNI